MTQDQGTPATTPTGAEADPIDWQEAVARLAAERTRAETCAALLKKYGDAAEIDQGALAYGEAKAEVDGVIAGLLTALAQHDEPAGLPGLEERLHHAVAAREAFAALVRPLVPEPTGEKDLVFTVDVAATIGPMVAAVMALWHHACKADRLAARTITTQLEAVRWPDFAAIAPAA